MKIHFLQKFISQTKNYLAGYKNFNMKDVFAGWNSLEITWFFLCVFLTAIIGLITKSETIIVLYSVLGVINLILVVKGKLINYIVGLVSCVLYAVISLQQHVYGQFLLFLFFFTPMQLYGWYLWSNPDNMYSKSVVKAKSLQPFRFVLIIMFVVVVSTIYGYLVLYRIYGQTIGLIPDSIVGVVSIVAFILMVKSYAEQWVLWIIVDILTICIWLDGLMYENISIVIIPLIITRTLTLVNACYGYISWIKMYKLHSKS